MKSLNQISFIDSSGNEIKLNANNTKEAAFDKVVGTVPLRDASGRFRIGNTGVSSTDGYVAVNKNYVDGRISAEETARQNAINALNKPDSSVAGQFVSAVSETNGIISVSRRAIVDSDGVVLKTGDQTITGTKTFKSVNFINFKDPEGRTNTALPNVCSINMGDDTTLFDCDAAGRIGLIGRDDPNTPGQNPNHTTGIRFFRSSSDNTVTNDYADFYYDSSNNRFEADKLIIAPRLQCTTAPSSNTDVVRKYDVSRINVYHIWAKLLPNTGDEVTWSRLTSFLSNNNWAVARVAKYDNSTLSFVRCSCQIGYTSYSSGLINSVTIEIPADFASYFGNKTKETFNRNGAAGTTVIQSQLLPYLMVQNLEYVNPF